MINVKNEIIKLNHSDLKRNGESIYRSKCPICKTGVMLMGRDPITGDLQKLDYCIYCGQHYLYLDIDILRNFERGEKC